MGDKGLIVSFGKYKDQPVERLIADQGYVEWLMTQVWFAERYKELAQVLTTARLAEPQDTPEHKAMVDRLMEDEGFWLYAAVGGSIERFKAWKLISAFPELKVSVSGACRDCLRDASTWGFDLFRLRGAGRPQRPANLPDELKVCSHSCPKIDAYTANFRCERIGGRLALTSEVEPKGADLRLDVTFFLRPKEMEQSYCVPVVRKRIVAELKPLIGDDFPAVIRQMKTARQFHGDGVMYVVVCSALRTSNLPIERVKRQFEQAGIRLLIETEVAAELPAFKAAVQAAVQEKNQSWPQELADMLATPGKQIEQAAALLAEVRRMNKEFCGYETAAEFEANREAAEAFVRARIERSNTELTSADR